MLDSDGRGLATGGPRAAPYELCCCPVAAHALSPCCRAPTCTQRVLAYGMTAACGIQLRGARMPFRRLWHVQTETCRAVVAASATAREGRSSDAITHITGTISQRDLKPIAASLSWDVHNCM